MREIHELHLPYLGETAATGWQLVTGELEQLRPHQILPPLPGRYTTRKGERMKREDLLPLVDQWVASSEGDARFIVQGGNRYISQYLRDQGIIPPEVKVTAMNKDPLRVHLSTLLTPLERQAAISPTLAYDLAIPYGSTRNQALELLADTTIDSPFVSTSMDKELAVELEAAVDQINSDELHIPDREYLRQVLGGTALAEAFMHDGTLHFIDDLFYRGRTLHSLAVIVDAFGGDPRNIHLTTIGSDKKSAKLESSYHSVLNNHQFYPFENSIRTEQGYWQYAGGRLIFTDMANYWEYLHRRVDDEASTELYDNWENRLSTWYQTFVANDNRVDDMLINPLVWLQVYHDAFDLGMRIDKIVDQKGYKIGACVPFAQLVDRFISQEEPLHIRQAFQKQIALILTDIGTAAQRAPTEFHELVDFYKRHHNSLDYQGLNFMFDNVGMED